MIALIPFGGIFSSFDERLEFLWLIKAIRINDLKFYMSVKFFKPLINFYIESRQKGPLNDPKKREETNEDLIFVTQKIYVRNFVKIMRLIFTILFITYFVGQYWFIFVDIIVLIIQNKEWGHHNDQNQKGWEKIALAGDESFLINEDWNFTEKDGYEQTIIAMYYALTSLSTTGFGDLYPRNTLERFLCSFMLLGGVTIFSYVLSELRFMIENFEFLNGDIDHKDELEEFFLLI